MSEPLSVSLNHSGQIQCLNQLVLVAQNATSFRGDSFTTIHFICVDAVSKGHNFKPTIM